MNRTMLSALVCLLLAAATPAQESLKRAYVCDRTGDDLWLLEDLNCDLDYNDPGEATRFFDSAAGLGNLLDNCAAVVAGPDGALYVSSLNNDTIVRLEDIDGDGTAHGAGEAVVVFDNSNASGIVLWVANNLTFGPNGNLWLAHANAGNGGTDEIYLLSDGNNDGDYNDAGEARPYYTPTGVPSVGDSLPADLHWGVDGALYYLDSGSTGVVTKGIYRLEDLDMNGTIDPVTEVTPFFLPTIPAGGSNQFFWGFDQTADGTFYMADTLNELVYAFNDANDDKTIDPSEVSVIWNAAGSSNIWLVQADDTGKIYCTEDQAPDRILALKDDDGNGTISIGETRTVYDDTLAPNVISSPRSIVLVDVPAAYAGNGSDIAIDVDINFAASEATSNIHCVNENDFITFGFNSPGNTLVGAPLLVLVQVFTTGSPAIPIQLDAMDPGPSLYLDLTQPIGVFADGFSPPSPANPFIPVVGGYTATSILPAGIGGLGVSVMLEMFALDPGLNLIGIGNAPSVEIRIL